MKKEEALKKNWQTLRRQYFFDPSNKEVEARMDQAALIYTRAEHQARTEKKKLELERTLKLYKK